jgi:hypothetical protein
MKIRALDAELFSTDGRTDTPTDMMQYSRSLFAILRTRLQKSPT